jgi:phosphoribosyl 1,2-cyclic phosphodiesterase
MKVINLSSGSDGNLTYIETEHSRILVDEGLSCKEAAQRLKLIGVDGESIDGIILTHEHGDHTKGVNVFSKKFHTPVYAHSDVWNSGLCDKITIPDHDIKLFDGDFSINDLVISPFEVPHDVKCFGFSITENNKKISIVTDLGHTTQAIFDAIKGSTLVYLEANHDVNMLKNSEKYPLSLKLRIGGANGHLSNDASAEFAEKLILSGTKQLVLSHLSKETNTPELAYTYICSKLAEKGLIEGEHFKIDVALTQPTTLFRLKN